MYPKNYYAYYVDIICTYAPHINSKIIIYFRLSHFFQIPEMLKDLIRKKDNL